MRNVNLEALKKCFKEVIPSEDSRALIDPFDFIASLVFSFFGGSKTNSIESIRRSMMAQLSEKISRHAFWERLSRTGLHYLCRFGWPNIDRSI